MIPFLGAYRFKKKNINDNTEYLGSIIGNYFQLRRIVVNEEGNTEPVSIGVAGFLKETMNRTEIILWVRPMFEAFIFLSFFAAISFFVFLKLIPSVFDSKQQIFSFIIVMLFLSIWIWLLLNFYKSYKIEKEYWNSVFEDVLDDFLI